MQWLKRL